MKLKSVHLKGFRNYKEATINFAEKTLIIGANDIGKTNLLWALRLLLDRDLPEAHLQPKDADFYAFEETNKFEITLLFNNAVEECILSRLKGKVSDENQFYISYEASRDNENGVKTYKLFTGSSIGNLEEVDYRDYIKVLNLKYIKSKRDLHKYINSEKKNLLQDAKELRENDQISEDERLHKIILESLETVDKEIPNLHYVSSATEIINTELNKISQHHTRQKVIFDTSTSYIDDFINRVSIVSQNNNSNVRVGGDGRLNQIFLALWASRNKISSDILSEVTLFCIEEPEAHLHPQQQRKMSKYLSQLLEGQVIITSHSAQITSEFSPNSIIRLFNKNGTTKAATNGCSAIIESAANDFSYRMSIIPAESFFADVILLVEGPSEEMFYRALAKQLGIDINQLNMHILKVDGIAFNVYIKILNSLEIPCVVRTDNDIFKIKDSEDRRYAGVQRGISCYKELLDSSQAIDPIINLHSSKLRWTGETPTPTAINSSRIISSKLEGHNIFIANGDLERDLLNSPIQSDIQASFTNKANPAILKLMQKRKAIFMYDFLKTKVDCLKKLRNDNVTKPLLACKKIIDSLYEESNT